MTSTESVSRPEFEISIADDSAATDAAATTTIEQVPIAAIERDPELNPRSGGVSKSVVKEYAEAMKQGKTLPPVVVFRSAKNKGFLLADGWHRVAASELAERTEISAEIREGGRREALLFAVGANASHGLRRTNADKRHAVALLLAAFPKKSDRWLGECCGVDHKTVARVRQQPGEVPQRASNGPKQAAKLAKAIDRVIGAWPKRDAEGRARFAEMLTEAAKRLAGESTVELAPDAATKPVKRAKGKAAAKAVAA